MESRAKAFGHPIHQQLIPFPLGLLGMAVIFDVIDWVADKPQLAHAAYYMIAAGIITGLLAAVFGLIDWFGIPGGTRAKSIATTHGIGNVIMSSSLPLPGSCAGMTRRPRRPRPGSSRSSAWRWPAAPAGSAANWSIGSVSASTRAPT